MIASRIRGGILIIALLMYIMYVSLIKTTHVMLSPSTVQTAPQFYCTLKFPKINLVGEFKNFKTRILHFNLTY